MTHKRARVFGEVVSRYLGRSRLKPPRFLSVSSLLPHNQHISQCLFRLRILLLKNCLHTTNLTFATVLKARAPKGLKGICSCAHYAVHFNHFNFSQILPPNFDVCEHCSGVFSENSRMTKVHSLGTFPASCICILLHSIV